MKCPICGQRMEEGFVQSAREIFFTIEPHRFWFKVKKEEGEVLLSSHNWNRPTCVAYICHNCQKVVIDYAEKAE
jgi:hypothetical protein